MKLPRFFNYYGSKNNLASLYAGPRYDVLIEPFAGSAAYSLLHWKHKVKLYDLDERICAIWDYLINVSEDEILSLPIINIGESVDDYKLTYEQELLISKNLTDASKYFSKRITEGFAQKSFKKGWFNVWGKSRRLTISRNLQYIRHWTINNISYEKIDNIEACWFIDPPYECVQGRYYKHNKIDFDYLASYCRSRNGQTIVCENTNSKEWLPFRRLKQISGAYKNGSNKKTVEVLWCSDDRDYPMQQQSLL